MQTCTHNTRVRMCKHAHTHPSPFWLLLSGLQALSRACRRGVSKPSGPACPQPQAPSFPPFSIVRTTLADRLFFFFFFCLKQAVYLSNKTLDT